MSPFFLVYVENVWYTLAPYIAWMLYNMSQTKSILCVIEHRCAWSVLSYSYVPVLVCTSEHKTCLSVRTCKIPPSKPRGRSYSQRCCVIFSPAVIVFTNAFPSFQSCVRLPRLYPCMCVYLPQFKIKCTTTILSAVLWDLCIQKISFVSGKKSRQLRNNVAPFYFFYQPFHISISEE